MAPQGSRRHAMAQAVASRNRGTRAGTMASTVGRAARLALLAVVVALAAGCARTPPEEALRAQVAVLQAAIEARDAGAVEDLLSEDFVGEGGMDRDGARRLASLSFMQRSSIGVTLGPLDVQLQGDTAATVRTTAALTGGSGRFLPDSGRVYDVVTGWRLESGEWRLASADWGDGPPR